MLLDGVLCEMLIVHNARATNRTFPAKGLILKPPIESGRCSMPKIIL